MTALPSVLLVHGAWHGAWAFDGLARRLGDDGWTVRTVELPSAGAGSTAGLEEDAEAVRAALAAHPQPTLLAGHSYGGIVVSEAAAGQDHVVGLAYLCAFQLDVDGSLFGAFEGQAAPWVEVDAEAGCCRALTPEQIFFNDCPGAAADAAVARLRPHSLAAFVAPQTAAAWRELPSSYLICERDQAIPLEIQERMSARADRVERIDSGHSPYLSRTDEVVRFLRGSAAML